MSDNFMNNANATSVVTAIGNKIKARDKTFYGTEEQWAALSTDQKKEYDFKATPDGGVTLNGVQANIEKNVLWIENNPLVAMENINVYVNPQTGVDDYAGGYGYSAAKPFASIDYAQKYIPKLSGLNASGNQIRMISLHLAGTFTSSSIKQHMFEFPATRFYLLIDGDVTFNNVILQFFDCKYAILRLNGNLTINITDTSIESTTRAIAAAQSLLCIDSPNATAQNPYGIIINGNTTAKSNIRGIEVSGSCAYCAATNTSIEVNQCNMGFYAVNASNVYFNTTKGSNNNIVFSATASVLMFGTNSATGTTVQKTASGGRIYTGQQ